MEKITNYVENLFFGFPRTEEVAKIKMQIIDNLVEKYQDLINSGKNENEAFGTLISDFGSMEELKKEFNIPNFKENRNEAKNETKKESQKTEELSDDVKKYREDFFKFQKKFAVMIGLGVVFCILGIILSALASGSSRSNAGASAVAFFFPVAIGVFLFIVAGIKQSTLKQFAQLNYSNSNNTFSFYSDSPIRKVIMMIALIIFLLFGFLDDAWHPAWLVFPIAALISSILEIIFTNSKKR